MNAFNFGCKKVHKSIAVGGGVHMRGNGVWGLYNVIECGEQCPCVSFSCLDKRCIISSFGIGYG